MTEMTNKLKERIVDVTLALKDMQDDVVRKAATEIFWVTATSIEACHITDVIVNKELNYDEMIQLLKSEVERLEKALKNNPEDAEVDLLLKDVVVSTICIQIKRERLGIDI